MNNELWKITKNSWLFFLDLIFPIECLGCGAEGAWICKDCFKKIKLKTRQYCLHCKKENDFGGFCPACGIIYDLDGVWIAALYDDPLVSLAVKRLKYYFITGLADDLGQLLILFFGLLLERSRILRAGLKAGLERRLFEQSMEVPSVFLNFREALVMPVPLSKKRLRWRGFNQAEILAKLFAQNYGLAPDNKNLARVRHKKPQAKLNEARRLLNVKDCFSWKGGDLNKKNIILIDDVVTTGATLNECAKVLKARGAGEVWGLVAAKG